MIYKNAFRLKKNGKPYCNCFCRHPELIENYDKAVADTTQTWDCHHRLETHNSDGERRLIDISAKELIALGMYYDRSAEELIFMTEMDHKRLHNTGNEKRGRKVSETMKGHKVSDETRRKMSEAKKGSTNRLEKRLSEETRGEISGSHKGTHWYNNGIKSVRAFECPKGFKPGRI